MLSTSEAVAKAERMTVPGYTRLACLAARYCVAAVLCISAAAAAAQSNPAGAEAKPKCSLRKDVRVYRSLMDPKNVADVFGTRIAKRYVAIQVTIANRCNENQFLVHDVSLDASSILPVTQLKQLQVRKEALRISNLSPELRREAQGLQETLERPKEQETPEAKRERDRARARLDEILETPKLHYELSSEELPIIQGVAEKGQIQDFRNRLYRYLRAAGSIAGGITGVAVFGHSFAPSVAAYNGPLLTAYSETFPDFTISQLIRLNASAYVSNRVIPKQQALVFVAFIPQAIFMKRETAGKFYKDPLSVQDQVDFRLVEVLVDGNFITEVPEQEPLLTGVVITPDEMLKFGADSPVVKGSILGQNLSDANVRLKGQQPDRGLRARLDGPAEDKRLTFVVESDAPVPPGTVLLLEVDKNKVVRTASLPVDYHPEQPVLDSVTPSSVDRSNVDATVTVTLTGKHFMSGDTRVLVGGTGVTPEAGSVIVKEGGSAIEAKLVIQAGATAGVRNVTVSTSGGSSKSVAFEVKEPGEK